MQIALPLDGFCNGPLFAHGPALRAPRRPPHSTTMPGILRRAAERRATPAWCDPAAMRAIFAEARRLTKTTGVVHSADHWVPLQNPLVCGLHCEANLRVVPLADNIRKSNNWWPDMWAEQPELFQP